ncbi:winged helix-turn-helix transcriptional regulator [Candidatus Woesearchaeota archaeon]|nr:winged helix-turn-helix transcriptional regulator [Candidatus Woesearchaeota archaeon]
MKDLYRMHAELCKVFSNPTRLEILNLLREDSMSVTELIGKTGLSQANISQHLAIMKSKGTVSSERRGKNVYYRLTNPKIIRAFDIIRMVLSERIRKAGNNPLGDKYK